MKAKRFLALILSFLLVMSSVSITVFADTEADVLADIEILSDAQVDSDSEISEETQEENEAAPGEQSEPMLAETDDNENAYSSDDFAAEEADVAKVGNTEYATIDEAIKAANAMTGDVTVEIYGKAEYSASTPDLTGGYDKISFVGKTDDAEICLTRNGTGGYIRGGNGNVYFTDLIISKTDGYFADDAGCMNLAFCVFAAKSVTYTNCSFPNGSCASQCKTTYENCTFKKSHDKYCLWTYGDNTDVEVDSCAFDDYRGIKLYSVGSNSEAWPAITVKNSDFSALGGAGSKPAIVLTNGSSVSLEGNTYSDTGVFELEDNGSSNGTTIVSDVTVTCVSDEYPNGCGVLVDGKIYRTVADASAVAKNGSTVTLLHNSSETVEFAEGVTLNRNGFTADGVTVEVPVVNVAYINGVGYPNLQAAINAVQNGETIEFAGDITEALVNIDKASGVSFTIDGKNNNFTGEFEIGIGENITISNINFVASSEISPEYFIDSMDKNSNCVLTIKNCKFTDTDYSTTAIGTHQPTKVVITECEANGVASLLQNQGGYNITVKDSEIEGKRGISLGTVVGATVENVTINAADDKYGIRLNGEIANNTITIKDCDIKAFIPVVVRKALVENYNVIFDGTNTMTPANTDGLWCAIGTSEYETNGTMPEAATGKVVVTLNDKSLDAKGVYGDYKVPVAKIGNNTYTTLADALEAASDGDTIELISGENVISAAGSVYGKSVTITGSAIFDWSKGWLFVGRGGQGNGTLTFKDATIKSASDSSSLGIHVSGREKGTNNKYDGTLIIDNSSIELDYLINRGNIQVIGNGTVPVTPNLIVKNGFGVTGRPSSETENGEAATATIDIKNGAYVKVLNHNGMGIGIASAVLEGYGVLNLEDSKFECENFEVVSENDIDYGTFNVKGNSVINIGTLSGNPVKALDGAVVENSTIGGEGIYVYGDVTFRGNNSFGMIYDYGDYYTPNTPHKWTIEKGASVVITSPNRYGLGYGDDVTIYGTLEEGAALTARESLSADDATFNAYGGLVGSTSGADPDANNSFKVKDAYVIFSTKETGDKSFGNYRNYYGNYDFDFENSVIDFHAVHFYEAANDKTDLYIKDSDVKVDGLFMTNDSNSTFTFENSKIVSYAASNGTDNKNQNAATMKLINTDLTYGALMTNVGSITLDAKSSITAPSITGAGVISIDATSFDGKDDVQVIEADMSGFTGTVEITGNDNATYEITSKGLVVKAAPVAQIGDTTYTTLADAAKDIATDGSDTTIKLLCDIEIPDSISFNYGEGDIIFTADTPVVVKQTAAGKDFDFTVRKENKIIIGENVTFEIYDNAGGFYVYYGPSVEIKGAITGGQNWGVVYLYNGTHTVTETGKLGTGRIQMGHSKATVKGTVDTNYLLVEGSTFTADGAVVDANVIYDNNNGGQRWGASVFNIKNGSEVNTSQLTLSYADTVFNMDLSSRLTADKVTGSGKIIIDATNFDGSDVQVIEADMSGFTGTVEITGNDNAKYEITETGLVITSVYGVLNTKTGFLRNLIGNFNDENKTEGYRVFLFAGIDSLNYANVGYEVKFDGMEKSETSKIVYASCKVNDKIYYPTSFGDDCKYIIAQGVIFGKSHAAKSFEYRVFATKHDGQKLYTEWKTVDGIYTLQTN